ncbi:MAG: 16S rRNA (cytosine(1402)-N(4))-methyltransferase RsmH [Acidimicrobiales bacterium]|jgi:16S rRNA (cytosine1402-N4)-methyltransferase
MTREFRHEPVMLAEVVEALAETPQGVIVDATVGGGGHAAALLEASSRHRLIGLDRDPEAIAAATRRLAPFGARARVVRARFDRLADVLGSEAPGEPVAGVLFDLGVSSRQVDEAERGFSYRFEAPLDMRMDPDEPLTAARVVNEWPEGELAALFIENGEPRFARRIARGIVAARPLVTTEDLADTVRHALPAAARQRGGHPAKRVFQAIRIAVNGELELLPVALEAALSALAPGGRAVVIAYHSGEDRLVKRIFADAAAGWCTCPPGLPCVCGAAPAVTVLTRGARMAAQAELKSNPRASSARLRIAERLDVAWRRTDPTGEET